MRTVLTIARLAGAVLLLGALLAGCGDDGTTAAGDRPLIVATTSIWGDVVQEVVGDHAEVDVLMPPGADPHSFQPSPGDVQRLLEADLVVANGLGLEASLAGALNEAFGEGVLVVRVAETADPLPLDGEHDDRTIEELGPETMDQLIETGTVPDDRGLDPHVWLDPVRTAEIVRDMGDLLAGLPGLEDSPVLANARRYEQEVLALHDQIQEMFEPIPSADRLLVASHDALGYFADRYGFEVVGVVVPGGSTQGEPSAAALAALADEIRERGVPAVFTDEGGSERVAQALANEAGRVEVVPLHTGQLGEAGSDADTYLAMMETNADRIATALTEGH